MVRKKELSKLLLLALAVIAPVVSVKSMPPDTVGHKTQKSGDLSSDSGEEQYPESVSSQRVLQLLENAGAYPEQESADLASFLVSPFLVEREKTFQAFMALPDSALTPEIVNGTNKNGATPFQLALSYYDTASMLRLIKLGAQADTLRLQLLADGCEWKVLRAILKRNTAVSENSSVSWDALRARYSRDKKRTNLVERIFQNQCKLRDIEAEFGQMESELWDGQGGGEQKSGEHLPELEPKQVLVKPKQQGDMQRDQVSGQAVIANEQMDDKPVSFLPESAALLAILFGGAALIQHYKIDRFWEQYL